MPGTALYPRGWGTRKPPAGTPVDLTHPVARMLSLAVDFSEGGTSNVFDYSANHQPTAAVVGAPAWTATPYGSGLDCGAGGNGYKILRRSGAGPANSATSKVSAFVVALVTINQQGTFIDWGEVTDNNSAWTFGVSPANGKLGVGGGGNPGPRDITVGSAVNDGKWHVHAVSQSAAGARNWMTDGVLLSDATTLSGGTSAGGLALGLSYVNQTSQAGDALQGKLSLVYSWDRDISVQEMLFLYQYPFCLFRAPYPRRHRRGPTAAAVAGTFNAAWAQQSNTLLGGGVN